MSSCRAGEGQVQSDLCVVIRGLPATRLGDISPKGLHAQVDQLSLWKIRRNRFWVGSDPSWRIQTGKLTPHRLASSRLTSSCLDRMAGHLFQPLLIDTSNIVFPGAVGDARLGSWPAASPFTRAMGKSPRICLSEQIIRKPELGCPESG